MLTDSQIRGAKPSEKPRKLFDARGLYLHVAPNGGRYWRFNYQFNGKHKTLALGVYPDVSLARARARHQEAREMLAEGVDPVAARKATGTHFEEAARAWYAHWKIGKNERHTVYVLRRLEADVFPQIGPRRLTELSASTFREVVQKIEQRGAVDIAKRVLQTCSQIMRHAVAHDLAPHNPVGDIKPSDVLKSHKRRNYPRVGAGELPDLLHAIEGYVGAEHTRLALQLMGVLPRID